METKTKVLSATYEILYIDNHFAKLNKVGSNFCIYEKVDNLPKGINVGDTIEKWYNKIANSYSYEIKRKKSFVEDNDENLCFVVDQFISQKQIKKHNGKIFEVSRWVVHSLYNHTVCLYNLNDFSEKKYVADCELLLNARKGDLYYFIKLGRKSAYIFDAENCALMFEYSKLFNQLDIKNKKLKQKTSTEMEICDMQVFDIKNTKKFNKKHKNSSNIVDIYCIEEKQNIVDDEVVFRLSDLSGNEISLKASQLPKYARVGDFVERVEQNNDVKYEFNRNALLKHLQDLNSLANKKRGSL